VPKDPGFDEFVPITGLIRNTSYYVAIESSDIDKSQSYISNSTSAYTLTAIPDGLGVQNQSNTSINLRWNTQNLKPSDTLTFQARLSTQSDFSSNVSTNAESSNSVIQHTSLFETLVTGTRYYFEVRSQGYAGLFSPWSTTFSTAIPVGLPTPDGFVNITATGLTARWIADGGANTQTTYQTERSSDVSFTPPLTLVPTFATVLITSAAHTGLNPNTTYWFQLQFRPPSGEVISPVNLGGAMTNVYRSTQADVTAVYLTSASFSWSVPQSNGPNSFYYDVRVATSSDFGGTLFTSQVNNSSMATMVSGFTPDTRYHAHHRTLNHVLAPASEGPVNVTGGFPFSTKPAVPGNVNPQIVSVNDYQIGVAWGVNGNPVNTKYRVEVDTDSLFTSVDASTVTLANATTHTFNTSRQLLANTTYFLRVRALATYNSPADDSAYLQLGSTLTAPTSPSNAVPDMSTTSMTLSWSSATVNAVNSSDTVYEVRAFDSELIDNTTHYVVGLSTGFAGLTPNTTYTFTLHALSHGSWTKAGPLSLSTATLAATPMAAVPAFTDVLASTMTARWTDGGNPPQTQTRYRVEVATNAFPAGPVLQSFVTVNSSHTFTGLGFNTTHYFQVAALNHNDIASPYFIIGSTPTKPVAPTVTPNFVTNVTSITVVLNGNLNPSDTIYEFYRDAGISFATVPVTQAANVGLSTNTAYSYYARAMGRDGSFSAYSATVSTWTLAARPPLPTNPGVVNPVSIQISFSSGTNPTASPSNTQFAIQATTVTPDGFPEATTHTNLYLGTPAGATHLLDSATPVWRTFSNWADGVVIATGLIPGRVYRFVVYARNGEDGSPGIPTLPSPHVSGQTKSGTPTIYYGGFSGVESSFTRIWVNNPLVPFVARGSFHTHYQAMTQNQISTINNGNNYPGYPGWDGNYNSMAPVSTANTDPDYTGSLSGMVIPSQGEWYLHVVGDPFFPPSLSHDDPFLQGATYRIHLDTTPPVGPSIQGQIGCNPLLNTTPILSGNPTPDRTPCFTWNAPDSLDATAGISPIVGYSYSLSTATADVPGTSTQTTGISEGKVSVDLGPVPLEPGATYYFKVRAKDEAGNWSQTWSTFNYVYVPDFTELGVNNMDLRSDVTIPHNKIIVGVPVGIPIQVVFSKDMDDYISLSNNYVLYQTRDHMGKPFNQNISLAATRTNLRSVTLTPAQPLRAGYQYELRVTTQVKDQGGDSLGQSFIRKFHVLMDPSSANKIEAEEGQSFVEFPPQSWGNDWVGVALNESPANEAMTKPKAISMGQLIQNAHSSARTQSGAFARPLVVQEFNIYNASGVRRTGLFDQPVRLTMKYKDSSGNGIVDDSEGTSAPIRAKALAIYWLDEETGAWVRVPGSVVDTAKKEVSVEIKHFSVYALLGAPALDLSEAYAYPVPYKPSVHLNGIRFTNLSSEATIKIYTVSGELVKTLHETDGDGFLPWNPVDNDDGVPLASDVYIYLIDNKQQKKVGKLVIVR
jgi:hypothetical protein